MTRRVVYGIGLWVVLAATAMTIASIILPEWITYESGSNTDDLIHYSYGLQSRCSSISGTCSPFPQYEDCQGAGRSFCSMWRSVGFLMSFAVILEFACVVAYAVIILGGKGMRDYGWKIVTGLLGLGAMVQCAGMAIVAFLYDHDARFFLGWRLDTSWILCTVSWSVLLMSAVGVAAAGWCLPEEGGYELIPSDDS
ncbi:hypothetical protein P152DRAFT_454155 [Eremomyces bilateralis CBS 781.70]|uniref:Uncharacterized protein n=1 Tax=Eremomyces bilateralis CBS 781.70 TaxID=1392243 RepID=A0A6G1GHU3_9PEZI|nr:uncharacterized protein P152DRAFT_454155 [Eremomyces bilateralis CBS 781.70]KAF1817574.1 hypothetical protein P152DRAFT_454155 [Eremomyces bilateralis CBS 781.70]